MTQPHQHIFRAIAFGPVRNDGAINHQDRQAQIPRRDQLGLSALPASVLAHHQIDGVRLHQCAVACCGERPAIDDQGVMGQARRLVWRIDKAQQIMMLRLGSEGCHMHPAQRQHDAAGRACQRCHRTVDAGNAGPAVSGDRLPRPAGQRYMRHSGQTGRLHGMAAHRCGKGVGRVDHMGDGIAPQGLDQTFGAAEAAMPLFEEANRTRAILVAVLRRMHDAGVFLVPGTDTGGSFTYHRELELYQQFGMTPGEILARATLDVQRYMGRDQQLGSIAKGKLADFFLIPGDPLKDLKAIKTISMVVKDGAVVE